MSKHKMILAPLVLAAMLLFTALPAHAISIDILATITGVNSAYGNPFEVTVGGTSYWEVTYDESTVPAAGLARAIIQNLKGPVGLDGLVGPDPNYTFVDEQDRDYPSFPQLLLINRNPVGIDFETFPMGYASISSVQLTTLLNPPAITYNTFAIFDTRVDGAPAMLLLGSGLVGLIAVRRKLNKA